MSTFYLVRHGEKEKVMGDPPLSKFGKKQAELTGQFLKNFFISTVFSSPLLRTKQTAEIIGSQIGLPTLYDDRLLERMNWGDKKDEAFEEFLTEWEKATIDRKYTPRHGTSAWETGERIRAFLLDKKHTGNTLVVTHGGAIGDFVQNMFDNLPLTPSARGVRYVKIFECSVTTIKKENESLILAKLNDISHLPEPMI